MYLITDSLALTKDFNFYPNVSIHNGIEEYENKDKTRVDCLTENNAVEFDFDAEYVTPTILKIQNGKCPYKDCKCNKKNKY